MKTNKLILSLFVVIILGVGFVMILYNLEDIGVGFDSWSNKMTSTPDTAPKAGQPGAIEASYVFVPFEEMITDADVILTGRVIHIGETKWNQDSGEYWEETIKDDIGETTEVALPYYEVTIAPEQIIADRLGIGEQLVVTIIGLSPVDYELASEDMSLRFGDEIIAFVEQRQLAWYEGQVFYDKETSSFDTGARKSVLTFMGYPDASYAVKDQEGLYRFVDRYDQPDPFSLDAVIELIKALRGML